MHTYSFVVPAFNEEECLAAQVERVDRALSSLCEDYEILVIDDGSTDRTGEIARGLTQIYRNVRVLAHPVNRGVGAAIKTGLLSSTKEFAFLYPADGQFDVNEINRFIPYVDSHDIIVGVKVERHRVLHRRLLSLGYNRLAWILFGIKFRDLNWVTMYRTNLIKSIGLSTESPIISTEILVKAKLMNARMIEVETSVLPRAGGRPTAARLGQIVKSVGELLNLKMALLGEGNKK